MDGRRLGEYTLTEVIGRGTMGEVWAGHDSSGAPVAVKSLYPQLARDRSVAEKFEGAARALTSVSHPNVVPVRAVVRLDDEVGVVTDRIEGTDLRQVLSRKGVLEPRDIALMGAGVADGLAGLHAAGFVHGDLKPENILLTRPAQAPMLVDFGLAPLTVRGKERVPATLRSDTLPYFAPEALDKAEPAPPADLYALGVVLYECCIGVRPFDVRTVSAALKAARSEVPVRPDGVPESLWEVISALLAKTPAERPGHAAEVADRLRGIAPTLDGLPAAQRHVVPPSVGGAAAAGVAGGAAAAAGVAGGAAAGSGGAAGAAAGAGGASVAPEGSGAPDTANTPGVDSGASGAVPASDGADSGATEPPDISAAVAEAARTAGLIGAGTAAVGAAGVGAASETARFSVSSDDPLEPADGAAGGAGRKVTVGIMAAAALLVGGIGVAALAGRDGGSGDQAGSGSATNASQALVGQNPTGGSPAPGTTGATGASDASDATDVTGGATTPAGGAGAVASPTTAAASPRQVNAAPAATSRARAQTSDAAGTRASAARRGSAAPARPSSTEQRAVAVAERNPAPAPEPAVTRPVSARPTVAPSPPAKPAPSATPSATPAVTNAATNPAATPASTSMNTTPADAEEPKTTPDPTPESTDSRASGSEAGPADEPSRDSSSQGSAETTDTQDTRDAQNSDSDERSRESRRGRDRSDSERRRHRDHDHERHRHQ